MAQLRIRRLRQRKLGERAYEAIRDLIRRQTFPPGSKLHIDQLCEDLGVSRTPVWDAMRRLETEGLVETVPRHGVFVLNFSFDRLQEVYAVREALDGMAARLAAERAERREIDLLAAVIQRLERATSAADRAVFVRGDLDFHNQILATAKNPSLSRLLGSIYDQILVFRLASLDLTVRYQSGLGEHREIFQAITARDADRAEHAARYHVRAVLEDVLSVLKQRGTTNHALASPTGSGGRGASPRRPARTGTVARDSSGDPNA